MSYALASLHHRIVSWITDFSSIKNSKRQLSTFPPQSFWFPRQTSPLCLLVIYKTSASLSFIIPDTLSFRTRRQIIFIKLRWSRRCNQSECYHRHQRESFLLKCLHAPLPLSFRHHGGFVICGKRAWNSRISLVKIAFLFEFAHRRERLKTGRVFVVYFTVMSDSRRNKPSKLFIASSNFDA